MQVSISTFLEFLTGGGLLGAAVKIGGAVRDFRLGFEALQSAVNQHVASPHPAPAPATAPQPAAVVNVTAPAAAAAVSPGGSDVPA